MPPLRQHPGLENHALAFPAISLLIAVLWVTPGFSCPGGTEPPTAAVHQDLDLSAWKGKVVLVDFWASWCGPCKLSFPWMQEMVEKYSDRGLVVVAVNVDQDPAAAAAFLDGKTFSFHHVNDPEGHLPEALGVDAMPTSFLFDRTGQPAYRHTGFHPEETAAYEEHIVGLLEGGAGEGVALGGAKKKRRGLRPWERGILALPGMSFDADSIELSFDDHIYFSKEASSGGRGFGGGGCGCN